MSIRQIVKETLKAPPSMQILSRYKQAYQQIRSQEKKEVVQKPSSSRPTGYAQRKAKAEQVAKELAVKQETRRIVSKTPTFPKKQFQISVQETLEIPSNIPVVKPKIKTFFPVERQIDFPFVLMVPTMKVELKEISMGVEKLEEEKKTVQTFQEEVQHLNEISLQVNQEDLFEFQTAKKIEVKIQELFGINQQQQVKRGIQTFDDFMQELQPFPILEIQPNQTQKPIKEKKPNQKLDINKIKQQAIEKEQKAYQRKNAAIKIQTYYRMFIQRKKYRKIILGRENRRIKRRLREISERSKKSLASRRIFKWVYNWYTTKKTQYNKIFQMFLNYSAITIQKNWRGYSVRRQTKFTLLIRIYAKDMILGLVQGYKTREILKRKRVASIKQKILDIMYLETSCKPSMKMQLKGMLASSKNQLWNEFEKMYNSGTWVLFPKEKDLKTQQEKIVPASQIDVYPVRTVVKLNQLQQKSKGVNYYQQNMYRYNQQHSVYDPNDQFKRDIQKQRDFLIHQKFPQYQEKRQNRYYENVYEKPQSRNKPAIEQNYIQIQQETNFKKKQEYQQFDFKQPLKRNIRENPNNRKMPQQQQFSYSNFDEKPIKPLKGSYDIIAASNAQETVSSENPKVQFLKKKSKLIYNPMQEAKKDIKTKPKFINKNLIIKPKIPVSQQVLVQQQKKLQLDPIQEEKPLIQQNSSPKFTYLKRSSKTYTGNQNKLTWKAKSKVDCWVSKSHQQNPVRIKKQPKNEFEILADEYVPCQQYFNSIMRVKTRTCIPKFLRDSMFVTHANQEIFDDLFSALDKHYNILVSRNN